jgi:hypothetical protein
MTTAIAFQGGSYGSYLKWVLYQLLFPGEITVPWDRDGSSHNLNYINSNLVTKGHLDYNDIESSRQYSLFTIHPVTDFGHNFIDRLHTINSYVNKLIIPYPNKDTYLLAVHNYLNKVWGEGKNKWDTSLNYIDPLDLKVGWGVDDVNEAPNWILREYFSYNIFNSFESQYGWYAPDHFSDGYYTFLDNLLYNFQEEIENIRLYLDVKWRRDPGELQEHHNFNLSKQKYIHQDKIAYRIINSINDEPICWDKDDITIFTEAFIQKTLREQGIVLKCTNLNDFPTSTKKLIEVFE